MIIDLILDRKDDNVIFDDSKGAYIPYNAHTFYLSVLDYGEVGEEITKALDYGEEKDVKQALCNYIIEQDYNPEICDYINSVEWLTPEYACA